MIKYTIWDKIRRSCRRFFYKLRRSLGWFIFTFNQNPWQEDYQLFEVIEKVILDTAKEFQKREDKGMVRSVDNVTDIRDMRLAAKLIRMRMEDHYAEKVTGEKYSFKEYVEADKKDQRCLDIAMKILAEKGFNWWV